MKIHDSVLCFRLALPLVTFLILGMSGLTDAVLLRSQPWFRSILASQPSNAIQLQDGTVYFTRPPRLGTVSTTRVRIAAANPTYYMTVTVPADAGSALQRLDIVQQNGRSRSRQIRFRPGQSIAFLGTRNRRGEQLTLNSSFDRQTQTLSFTFDPPVPPDTVLTLGLRPERNPRQDGVYLLGVTAFPVGEKSYGQFLGFGQLSFYDEDGNGLEE